MRGGWAILSALSFIGVLLLGFWVASVLPDLLLWADGVFSPGLGLKNAALIAFALAFVMIIVMAVAAGDGILGELGVMVPGVLVFFVICWLMLAWVF